MMRRQSSYRYKFFMKGFSLEKRIRKDHVLRRIFEKADFDFIYEEVKDTYGENAVVKFMDDGWGEKQLHDEFMEILPGA